MSFYFCPSQEKGDQFAMPPPALLPDGGTGINTRIDPWPSFAVLLPDGGTDVAFKFSVSCSSSAKDASASPVRVW
jgi:hypothetical protein